MTAKELAKMLNVSEASVSLALNGRSGISEETRSKILEAAERFGISKKASNTVSQRFISLVIFKKHGLVYGETPFFSAVLEGISASIADAGYLLQISYFYGNQDYNEQIKIIENSACDGVIFLATEAMKEDLKALVTLKKPFVLLDSHSPQGSANAVIINNSQGAYNATRYLIDCGHRNIGHLSSSVRIQNFIERQDGVHTAIREYPDCSLTTVKVESTQDGAYLDMMAYLDTKPDLPSAFFADNDIIAISCMRALKEHGLRIPQDVSLVGFDDMPMAYVTSPKLTTIQVPKEALGQQAVRLLENLISNPSAAALTIEVNTELIIRDSVKQINS